jgi:hypothetical protein
MREMSYKGRCKRRSKILVLKLKRSNNSYLQKLMMRKMSYKGRCKRRTNVIPKNTLPFHKKLQMK